MKDSVEDKLSEDWITELHFFKRIYSNFATQIYLDLFVNLTLS